MSPSDTPSTLRGCYAEAAARLAAVPALRHGAARDAEYLLLHALALPRTALLAHPSRPVSAAERASFDALIRRRLLCEPIQYIIGAQEFFGLPFAVTPATLIPRPETELLVEAVLARMPHDRPVDIVDVGTGSGAIAVALAHSLPEARLLAIDLSTEALEVARGNAGRNGVSDRVRFRAADLLEGRSAQERFDAVVSNPPYVPEGDRPSLHPEVSEFEPGQALFAGEDGLDVYRRLIPQAWDGLRPGGLLALEIGFGQAEALDRLLEGWDAVEFLNDLQAIARVVLARRPGA